MYASIRRYRVEPERVDRLKRILAYDLVPALSEVPGFVAYYLLDAGNGVVMSVSIFQDRAGADESTSLAADGQVVIRALLPEPPEVTAGEIVLQRVR